MTITAPAAEMVDFLQFPMGTIAVAARDAIVMIDDRQDIVAVNEAAAQMFGYGRTDLLGTPLSRLIPEGQRAAHERHIQPILASDLPERRALSHESLRGLRANGQAFPAEISISSLELLIEGQQHKYFVAMLRDLSIERDLRAEVAMLTARLRAVLDLTPVAIWIVDGARVVFVNRAATALFGVPDGAQLTGQSIHTLLQVSGPATLQAHLDRALAPDAKPDVVSGTVLRADGQTRHVDITTTALPDHGSTVIQMVIIDVTEKHDSLLEQTSHRQELRRLAASVVEAREEERRRIARELHDELGQRLTALKMEISSLRNQQPWRDDGGRVTGMLEMVDSSVSALRRLAADLRPLMLDDLGLNSAIESLARDAARRMDIEVTVGLDAEDARLAPGVDIALYRMVQEALTNVGRHANATDVRIELRKEGDELVLKVRDNGKGFPERAMGRDGRYGLLGIRERVFMLGGRLVIDNPPGGGGRIVVHLPLGAASGVAPEGL
jgi:PAS domain S-box-containing protein